MHRVLVDRAKKGDVEAFDALARTVGDRCMAIACRILRDADLAEDAVQAALITAWRELRTLRDPDRFEPWLHRILTNECYAAARRRRRWIGRDPAPAGRSALGDRRDPDRQRPRPARARLPRLTLEQRTVLVFHHYLGLPLTEIADRLGIPVGTVKSRLHHAITALRASLEADARTPTVSQENLA